LVEVISLTLPLKLTVIDLFHIYVVVGCDPQMYELLPVWLMQESFVVSALTNKVSRYLEKHKLAIVVAIVTNIYYLVVGVFCIIVP